MADDASSSELIIDLTDPVAPVVTTIITNDTTPTITGTATVNAGDKLSVTVDGIIYSAGAPGSGNALVDNGDGTWDLTIPAANAVADGTYAVTATVTDLAGNAADDISTSELTVDTVVPAIPTVATLYTNDTTPLLNRHRNARRCRDA